MEQAKRLYCYLCKYEFQCKEQDSYKCEKCQGEFCEELNNEQQDDPRQFVPFGEQQNQNQQGNQQQMNQQQQQQLRQPVQQNQLSQQQQQILNNGNVRIIQRHLNNNGPFTSTNITIRGSNNGNPFQLIQNGSNGGGGIMGLLSNVLSNNNLSQINFGNDQRYLENIIDMIMRNDPNQYGTPPASKQAIDSLKKMEYQNQIEQKECFVCKEEYKEKEQVIEMPCKHYFHPDCLLPWLQQHNSCPACRYELPTDDEDYEARKLQQRQQEQQSQQQQQRQI